MSPRATYRLQFHAGFPFQAAAELAPYLARLGVSHVYASPIATARAGSMHGYDVVDPTRINPELGGEEAFREMVAALRRERLGVILDIVPNHMAVGAGDNPWWLDVLEKGEASAYAAYFDIDWRGPDPALQGKVLAPFLGSPYAQALASGDVRLEIGGGDERLSAVAYGHHRFPIRREDHAEVREAGLARFDPGEAAGRQRLHELFERQHWRLAWWRTAGDEINWRRFFDITELAGLRVEQPEVFEAVHALPLRLYAEGLVDGVRVDHVDGLADPAGYCRALRARLSALEDRRPDGAPGGPAYLVVEKILAPGERLPADWRCDGTSGYDFMNEVSALLHDPAGEAPLTRAWAQISGRPAEFEAEERAARREILTRGFAGQLDAAVRAFHRLARADVATRDVTAAAIRRGLEALLSVFSAYRTYGTAEDAPRLSRAVQAAKALAAPGEGPVLDQLALWLAPDGPGDSEARREAARRFQQLSAPVAAKAVEDTAFYRYGRLLSRNDVGFDPARLGSDIAAFHAACGARAADYPDALLATATHDHKRGEDVRARLAVLSEIPERWTACAQDWLRREAGEGVHPADAYQAFQMLLGAYPLGLRADDRAGLEAFRDRVAGWQQKALREAKLRSSWAAPDQGYEGACQAFLARLLDPAASGDFLHELAALAGEIAPAGAVNGLTQALLRCTVPGVPDLYQGAEFWDLSLVDPDNRRPVDFAVRSAALDRGASAADLLHRWTDGAVKQALIAGALAVRAEAPELFARGAHVPLGVRGAQAGSVIAFLRRLGDDFVLVAAAVRCAAAVAGAERPLPSAEWWGDTQILVPADLPPRLSDRLGGGEVYGGEALRVSKLFARLPAALVTAA